MNRENILKGNNYKITNSDQSIHIDTWATTKAALELISLTGWGARPAFSCCTNSLARLHYPSLSPKRAWMPVGPHS